MYISYGLIGWKMEFIEFIFDLDIFVFRTLLFLIFRLFCTQWAYKIVRVERNLFHTWGERGALVRYKHRKTR